MFTDESFSIAVEYSFSGTYSAGSQLCDNIGVNEK